MEKLKLDRNRRRVETCPCGKSNRDGKFVPYETFTDKGYCHSCGETFPPDHSNDVALTLRLQARLKPKPVVVSKPITPMRPELLRASLQGYEENNFVIFLDEFFGAEITSDLIKLYLIGTSRYQHAHNAFPGYRSEKGSTVFWQIDITGKIRRGKIMMYNPETGKRVKEPFDHVSWAHYVLRLDKLPSCFFGEHLLRGNTKPVGIVESEKTAIIASAYFPKFLWLATGAKGGLSQDKCHVLKGRTVTLFPDTKGFDEWTEKAKELSQLFPDIKFNVSALLQSKTSQADKEKDIDLADYLLGFNPHVFQDPEPTQPKNIPTPIEPNEKQSNSEPLDELKEFYATATLPAPPLVLKPGETITDVGLMVDTGLLILKENRGNKTFQAVHERLVLLKQRIQSGSGSIPFENTN